MTEFIGEVFRVFELDGRRMYFVTDEGSNVVHLGGNMHHRCNAHIFATISRHVTEFYIESVVPWQLRQTINQIANAIRELHQLVGELRLKDWIVFFLLLIICV